MKVLMIVGSLVCNLIEFYNKITCYVGKGISGLVYDRVNLIVLLQLTVGVIGREETVFDKPPTPAEICSVIYSTIQPYDVIQAVLQQEIVLYCGRLIATNPDMFKGILKIRVG